MNNLNEYLPFLIPLFIVEVGLALFSAIHVWKHNYYRFGNRALWMVIVLVIQILGPLIYFVIGRGEDV